MPAFLASTMRGMAATEFLLVSIPLLLVGLGAFEAAHWHRTRQAAGFALLESARAGAVSHADPAAIEEAFRKALQPLGSSPPRLPDGQPPWRIEILSPRAAHFIDFPGPDTNGMRTISHAYQDLQHRRAVSLGRPGGRGSLSGDTIFGANTLSLRLQYLHAPLVPGMRSLLRQLGASLPDAGFAAQSMRRTGALPILQTVAVTMQSSPWDWQHGGQVLPDAPSSTQAPTLPTDIRADSLPCIGIWCNAPSAGRPWQPDPGTSQLPAFPSRPVSPAPASAAPVFWDDTEQACQAALCCAVASG